MDSSVHKKKVEARKNSLRRKLLTPSQIVKVTITTKHAILVNSKTNPFIINKGICIARTMKLAAIACHISFLLKLLLLIRPRIKSQKK